MADERKMLVDVRAFNVGTPLTKYEVYPPSNSSFNPGNYTFKLNVDVNGEAKFVWAEEEAAEDNTF